MKNPVGSRAGFDDRAHLGHAARFGESLTTARPWNMAALAQVERLNGRVAMVGFAAVLVIEALTGDTFLHWAGLVP